jgi:hypothetical protein
LRKDQKLQVYSYEHNLLRGSAGPKAGEVTRYWKNYIRSFKICILHLNRVRIEGRMAGNYTSFENDLNAREMLEKREKVENLGVNGRRRGRRRGG